MSRLYHFGKYAFPRHNAVTHPFIDLTVAVAFLSDLRQLQHRISDLESGSHRKRPKIVSFYDQILAKCTKIYFCTFCPEIFNLLKGQQTHLPVPFAAVSISLDSPILNQIGFLYLMLLCTALFTDTDA